MNADFVQGLVGGVLAGFWVLAPIVARLFGASTRPRWTGAARKPTRNFWRSRTKSSPNAKRTATKRRRKTSCSRRSPNA